MISNIPPAASAATTEIHATIQIKKISPATKTASGTRDTGKTIKCTGRGRLYTLMAINLSETGSMLKNTERENSSTTTEIGSVVNGLTIGRAGLGYLRKEFCSVVEWVDDKMRLVGLGYLRKNHSLTVENCILRGRSPMVVL
jgi:hypothetical protein